MKRRSVQQRKLRDRRSGQSCYAKYAKTPYKYRWQAPWKKPKTEGDRT